MSIGQPEHVTQERIVKLFQDELGYRFLGDWTDRAGNSNIEDSLLTAWLLGRGYTTPEVNRALDLLHTESFREELNR